MNQHYSDLEMTCFMFGKSIKRTVFCLVLFCVVWFGFVWSVCLTQEVEFCGEIKSVAVGNKGIISSILGLHVINRKLVGPGDTLPDVTKETTLIVTHNYAKHGFPGNILHNAISQSEKHTKWLSPCVTAVALAYLLP